MEWPFRKHPKIASLDLLTKGKHFCMMPWVHLHITQNGNVAPCCQAPWDEKNAFGNINTQSISDIWNGKEIQKFRETLLKDKPDQRCSRCYQKEESGWQSLRQITNGDYGHHLPRTISNKDVPPALYLDIRFTNLCNLKCRICGPWSSSQWQSDAVALGMLAEGQSALSHASTDEEALFAQLKPNLGSVEEIYFAGGEPLLMEQHYRLLDMLLEAGNMKVKLKYNTNFSRFGLKDWNVLEAWKHFDNVNLAASLDASGKRGEFLRKGLDWLKVETMRKEMMQAVPHVQFICSPTVYALNVLHLPDFHQDWVKRGLISVEDFVPSLLMQPEAYNIRVLPPKFKNQVQTRYLAHLQWMKTQKPKNKDLFAASISRFKDVVEHLKTGDHSHLLPELQHRTEQLDDLRNESYNECFPELKGIFG